MTDKDIIKEKYKLKIELEKIRHNNIIEELKLMGFYNIKSFVRDNYKDERNDGGKNEN